MVRWEPGASDRLQAAALALYAAHGFEQTTVAEIAEAAGVTERTFYRHFADKREVVFGKGDLFQQAFSDGVAAAPATASPLEAVEHAVISAAGFFADDHRDYSRLRSKVIAANPDLHERELRKMAHIATVLVDALRARGVTEPIATISAETGAMVFRLSFAEWIAPGADRSLAMIERDVFAQLKALNS